jgi:hypothetical protein
MIRLVVKSKVGSDGILHLELPLGVEEADTEVRVTVEPVAAKKPITQEEWRAWVDSMAGSITDLTFERPPQGDFEERQPLS